jgi:hypothetical protein
MRLVLDTAVNGCAAAPVTFNSRDLAKVAKRFGIAVMLPSDTYTKLQGEQDEKE